MSPAKTSPELYRKVDACRVCGSAPLVPLLDLGQQALTGVFPKKDAAPVAAGPIRLVKCYQPGGCGLVQLEHSYRFDEIYGDNYGYRSGLNASMVRHLRGKVERILSRIEVTPRSIVLDIGSNDGTTLAAYPAGKFDRIGIDPTASKFRDYYPADVKVVCDFFSEKSFRDVFPGRQASVVTSFAMFYDLESPLDFMNDVRRVLADDGVWVLEQSYLPLMLERNSYDTICHEHLEYYSVALIDWMTRKTGFKIVDLEFNDVNGGSFSVMVAKTESAHRETPALDEALARERTMRLDGLDLYAAFTDRVTKSRESLRRFLADARAAGKTVAALGASTKGNVLLQYCGLGPADLVAIGEVNEEKFGCVTPGTLIPIRPEAEVIAQEHDYLIVLPWHFRETFLRKLLKGKSRLVFPLPAVEVI